MHITNYLSEKKTYGTKGVEKKEDTTFSVSFSAFEIIKQKKEGRGW
jgi:hypothetical protein